jgi:hypothetical protein
VTYNHSAIFHHKAEIAIAKAKYSETKMMNVDSAAFSAWLKLLNRDNALCLAIIPTNTAAIPSTPGNDTELFAYYTIASAQ